MTDGNGRFRLDTGNSAITEVLRFALFFVLFLWLASSMNGRFLRIETANKSNHNTTKKRLDRIEKKLDLSPLIAE